METLASARSGGLPANCVNSRAYRPYELLSLDSNKCRFGFEVDVWAFGTCVFDVVAPPGTNNMTLLFAHLSAIPAAGWSKITFMSMKTMLGRQLDRFKLNDAGHRAVVDMCIQERRSRPTTAGVLREAVKWGCG
jgi:hypothetical protein